MNNFTLYGDPNDIPMFDDDNMIYENHGKELHFRVQQRGRKNITIISGIESLGCDLKKLSSKLSSHFSCSCSIKTISDGDDAGKKIFKMSGDHRQEIKEYLLEHEYVDKYDVLTIHG